MHLNLDNEMNVSVVHYIREQSDNDIRKTKSKLASPQTSAKVMSLFYSVFRFWCNAILIPDLEESYFVC